MTRLRIALSIAVAAILTLGSLAGSQAGELNGRPVDSKVVIPKTLAVGEKDVREVAVYKTTAGLTFSHPSEHVEGWCYTVPFPTGSSLSSALLQLNKTLPTNRGAWVLPSSLRLTVQCIRPPSLKGWIGKGTPWMTVGMTDRVILPAGPNGTVLLAPIFVRASQKGSLGNITAVSFTELPLAALPSAPTKPNWVVSGATKILRWSKPTIEGSAPVKGYFVEGGELNKGKLLDINNLQTEIAPITGVATTYEISAFSEVGVGPKVSISVNPTTKPTFVVPLTFIEVRLGVTLRPAFEIMAVPAAKQAWKWHLCEKTAIAGLSAATVGKKCKLIATAKGSTYLPLKTDLGKYIAATVTSTNTKGSTSSFTFGQVKSFFQGGLVVTPALVAGGQYSLAPFGWLSSIKPTVAYQWVTCNSAKLESVVAKLPSDCIAIKGATRQTFTPGANLRSHLAMVVTATDKKYGTVVAMSPSIELITPSK
jgi:hypothetical protein